MKIFQIENPCEETWDNMHDIPEGKYCDLCSKKVLDLTQKTDDEIFQLLEMSNGKICGKIFQHQSNRNFPRPEKIIINHEKRKGYSRLIAGLTIAASLTGIQTNAVTIENSSTEISEKKNQPEKDSEEEKTTDKDFIISGSLINSETGQPLQNIEVTLITKEKIFKANTNQDGIYKLIVPAFYIQNNNNVLHFDFGGYNDKEYILTKDELRKKQFSFNSSEIDEAVIIAGGISSKKLEPTILLDGEEITEKELYELNRKDFKIFHFYGKTAKAIYSDTSKDGLYLVFSK
ncbi:carboxypeptidase-like regulatory domain-containing protein [Chryseobacterium sp. RG1]|uniref:Carboxypeptidase-like regulatory domain-containing protein n=1 Tax=Chryseobacterium tagetis TaxID=2801334 RepID=A0ABS8A6Y4_9FLAO|nr:carboxypeptidase-like regulatory domain-containing protein [Chryseobacterium tagetis]MCA6069258.1 carboxypeptidase-like regulatory domain-containing protein [Chryseobacterium tagetis]